VTLFSSNVPIMGEAARGWLSQGQSGKVLAAVDHATYLLTETGKLVWLATTGSPKHRRCILWPAPYPRLAVDSTFLIWDRAINLESGTKLDLSESQVWQIPALPVSSVVEIRNLPIILFSAYELVLSRETPVGLGAFIRPVLQIAKKQDFAIGFQPDSILNMKAWPMIERIAPACLAHDLPGTLNQAEALIGLGDGLTPSGDDFLGGLFFARHLLLCSYPQLDYLEFDDLPEWINTVQSRTNLISFALLKDNVTGYALEPLNRFGIALLTNQPVENACSAASDLIKVGHSTGWSLLTGFLVGMLLARTD
jgi:Protein of unknown function (DUF2877)